MDYDGWLQFQQALYRIVRDPLFELAITVCIVLNTMFLAMEHHGMSEEMLKALDIGNKVRTKQQEHQTLTQRTILCQSLVFPATLFNTHPRRFLLPFLRSSVA